MRSRLQRASGLQMVSEQGEQGEQGAAVGTGSDEGVAGPAVTTVGGGLLLSLWGPHRSGPEGTGSSQVPALWSPPKSSKSPTQLPSRRDQLKGLKRLELAAASTHGPHARLR